MTSMPVFTSDEVAAVLHHMNDDHRDDNVLIVRAFSGRDADRATMRDLDERGGTWLYSAGGEEHELHLPWSETLTARPQIRREIVTLYDAACTKLGIEPRPH